MNKQKKKKKAAGGFGNGITGYSFLRG